MRQNKILLVILSLCICLTAGLFLSVDVNAEEYEDRPYTGMDADGNIYELEDENGLVDEGDMEAYADSNEKIVNFKTKTIDKVTYYVEAGTGYDGYLNGSYGADGAYLGEENGKIKFMMSGVVGLVDKSDVQVIDKSSAKSISYYTVSNGMLLHYLTYNMDSGSYATYLKNGYAPSYLSEGVKYYSYDGHYFYNENQYGVMLEDYRNNRRSSSVNPSSPYYNYFQFLPMRSTSSYSGGNIDSLMSPWISEDSKMKGIGSVLVNDQNTYGVNALLTASLAANESGWGKGYYAVNRNNLFSINAVDANPDDAKGYASVDLSIKDFTETYMSKRYLNPTYWSYWGGFLGNKASGCNVKYASDPFWGEKAASIAWNLDASGGNADRYVYTLAIKDTLSSGHSDVAVRSESSSNSTVMYSSGTQSNTAFIIMDKSPQNGFYMVQSDGVLNGDRSGVNSSSGTYDFNKMFGYISTDSVTVVNEGGNVATGIDRFMDVSSSDWFYEYVSFVYDRGIMTGLNNFTFGPSVELSRAQFATILYRMAGSPAVSYQSIFPDVADGTFYSSAVIWAYKNNVITGYESGNFGPSDMLTREQMAVLMYRYAEVCGLDISDSMDLNSFPDAANVSTYAKKAMSWTAGAGLIKGDQGKLNPQGNASRAQCATIIKRYMEKYGL